MKTKLRSLHVFLLLLVVLIGPVLFKQIWPVERRQYDWVSLDETQYTEVTFRNTEQQLDLGGMLFVPAGHGPFPAAVIIHGSGTSRRDSGWYLTLTNHLQQNGIAVLLPDKRGSEKSQGDWRVADFHDLATDTLAAVEFLRAQNEVPVSRIGIIGMSQGGWIAPIVASESSDVKFVVSMVGSAVTPTEQLIYEENHNLRQMGFLPGVSNVIALASTAYIRNIAQAEFWDWVANYDPVPYWREVNVPALALYGADDTNVPSEESVKRLNALGKSNLRIEVYEGSGHALQDPVGRGNSIIREEALAAIRSTIELD
ncbi:MAG: alpha/beta fold hydrolase [Woeseiaceae bacterium]|nr:alpha/beta fold hydrolase [Woeseiaceae bacterium]